MVRGHVYKESWAVTKHIVTFFTPFAVDVHRVQARSPSKFDEMIEGEMMEESVVGPE